MNGMTVFVYIQNARDNSLLGEQFSSFAASLGYSVWQNYVVRSFNDLMRTIVSKQCKQVSILWYQLTRQLAMQEIKQSTKIGYREIYRYTGQGRQCMIVMIQLFG